MLYKSQFSQLLLFNSFIYSQWINTFATKLKSYKQYTDGYFVDTSRGSDHICPFWKGSMYPASNKICPRVCKTSLEGKKTNLDLLAWQDIKTCGHSTCKWNRFKARIHIFWTNLQSQSCFVLNMLKIITIPNCTLNYIADIHTAVTLLIITTKMKQECWSMYKTLHLRSYSFY